MSALEARIDKVLSEQFANCPKPQREYARRALVAALGLEIEEVARQPVSVPEFTAEGEPVMCTDCVVPRQRHRFEWVDRRRWVTPWEDAGPRISSEEMHARMDDRMAEVAAKLGVS